MSDLVTLLTYAFTWRTALAVVLLGAAAYTFFGTSKRGVASLLLVAALAATVMHVMANAAAHDEAAALSGDEQAQSVERLRSALRCCATPEKVTPLEPFAAEQCLGHLSRAKDGYCRDDASCLAAARTCEAQRGLLETRAKSPSSLGR